MELVQDNHIIETEAYPQNFLLLEKLAEVLNLDDAKKGLLALNIEIVSLAVSLRAEYPDNGTISDKALFMQVYNSWFGLDGKVDEYIRGFVNNGPESPLFDRLRINIDQFLEPEIHFPNYITRASRNINPAAMFAHLTRLPGYPHLKQNRILEEIINSAWFIQEATFSAAEIRQQFANEFKINVHYGRSGVDLIGVINSAMPKLSELIEG